MSLSASQLDLIRSLENTSGVDPAKIADYLDFLVPTLDRHRDGREPVAFFMPTLEWLGHVCQDAHVMKALYDPKRYQLFFLISRPRWTLNPSAVEVALRDVVPVHVGEQLSAWNVTVSHVQLARGIAVRHRGYEFVFGGQGVGLVEQYSPCRFRDRPLATFRLTDEEVEARSALFAHLGIERDAKIVVLHARSPKYWGARSPGLDAVNSFRDADIAGYGPAIELLIDSGYHVVRIGDDGMDRSPIIDERFLDAPFHPDYTPFLDVAVTSCCDLFLHSCSGPMELARGFGRRLAGVNGYLNNYWSAEPGEFFLAKGYELVDGGGRLSIPELINLDLCAVRGAEDLARAGVRLVENTPAEIRSAIAELVPMIDRGWVWSTPASQGFRALARQEHERRLARYDPTPSRRTFQMWQPSLGMAAVALETQPDLLEGEFLPLEDRPFRFE